MSELRFTWDDAKAAANRRKHGVSFEEAATVFADPLAMRFDDVDHSDEEDRFILIGTSIKGRLLLVVFVEPESALIRIISARRVTRREREDYFAKLGLG